MSLEGFSKRGMELGNDPERINETKNDLRQQYINAIKRLALEKMRNDVLFEGKLGAAMRNLSSLGLDISRESMLKDIETEVNKQRMIYDIDFDIETPNLVAESQSEIHQPTQNNNEIEQLKNNLGSIFASAPSQEQKPINTTGAIPREPAIQSTRYYEAPINNLSQESEQVVQQAQVHTEPEKQEIREQLQQAQEDMKQQLELAKQQSNEPTMTFTGNLENLSDAVKKRIIEQMEARCEVIISNIDNIYQEGNYIVVDAKDNQGRFTGAEFTLDDFSKLVNQPSTNISHVENLQQPTENNINQQSVSEQQSLEANPQVQQVVEQPQQQTEQILQEQQKQMKDKIVSQIMGAMNNAGEFSFGDISMGERMSIMQNVQNKLNAKSMDELQMLLSTYQEQNVQEETMHSGMHR